jgi:hypothetical protein
MSNNDDFLIKQFDITDNLLQQNPMEQDSIILNYIKLILKHKNIKINSSYSPYINHHINHPINPNPYINIYNNNYDRTPTNNKLVSNTSMEYFTSFDKDGFKDYYPLNN